MHPLIPRLAIAVLAFTTLWVVRPGVVQNAAQSPRAWAVVAVIAVAAILLRRLLRPRIGMVWAGRVSTGAVVGVVALLLAPSFSQRTLVEAFPTALQADAVPAPALPSTSSTKASIRSVLPQATISAPAEPRSTAPQPTASQPTASQPTATNVKPSVAPPAAAPPVQPAVARQISSGQLHGIGHSARGGNAIYLLDGRGLLRFEDVNIEGTVSPSVHLVRRGARTPSGGIRLGALKAERGSFSYQLPASVDLGTAWTVLVWCDPFNTPIAATDLG